MSRAFQNALRIGGIEDNATADLTASEIKTAYLSNADTNQFGDAKQSKLTNLDDDTYITPTFLNNWVNYSSTFQYAGYHKDESGTVHIKGLVKSGTVNTAVFQLPVGYRPLYTHILPADGNSVIERIDVTAAGNVMAYCASNAWISIECSFKAEQ